MKKVRLGGVQRRGHRAAGGGRPRRASRQGVGRASGSGGPQRHPAAAAEGGFVADFVRDIDLGVEVGIAQKAQETDIVRTLTLLPGVSTVGEASSGFNVRGGNADQNLINL